jgi:hypothetical protein
MNHLPNLTRLTQADPTTLTARELQVALIYRDANTAPVTELDKAQQTTRLGHNVPALLAYIDELHGEINALKAGAR